MRRALVLPVSAAVVGALLAIGVSALDRSVDRSHDRVHVIRSVDRAELAEVEVDLSEVEKQIAEAMERVERIEVDTEIRLEGEFLREVGEKVRRELRASLVDEELTPTEQEQLLAALEQLEEQLPTMMGLPELVDGLTKDDGAAHERSGGN
jgi:hypothetical protein